MSTFDHYATYNYDEMMQQEILIKSRKLKQNHEIKKTKASMINRLLAGLMILLVFGSMAYLLIRYAEINEIKYNNFALKQEIESLSIQVEELKLQIESSMSLDNIEEYAINKLEMQYPQDYQTIYIGSQTNYALNIENVDELVDNSAIVINGNVTKEKNFVASIIESIWN
ncbi:MAG: cell division protein FtsL [Clostridiales bacterium]|nr:cell division protein FtsL [Clostridiales bacterium]